MTAAVHVQLDRQMGWEGVGWAQEASFAPPTTRARTVCCQGCGANPSPGAIGSPSFLARGGTSQQTDNVE